MTLGKSAGRSDQPWRRATARLRREAPPICHVCGRDIDLTLHHTDPWSWTADHVVPLVVLRATGGDPCDPVNLRPAHRRCNSIKGAGASPIPVTASRRW